MSALGLTGWVGAGLFAIVAVRLKVAAAASAERVARASHELRGPLHAAGMALHAARRGLGTERMLVAVELELERAALVLCDLEARTTGCGADRVDLTVLVERQAGAWAALADAAGRELRVDAGTQPLMAGGGAARIAQVLGNLVANALEHGAGRVDVRLRALGRDAVVVEITDEGLGLPATVEVLAARPRGGRDRRGRGLAIATDIVAALGGKLSGVPDEGGARIVLELPAPTA